MSQIFNRSTNAIARLSIWGAVFILGGVGWAASILNRSAYNTNQGVTVKQPVPFGHEHHVAGPRHRLPLLPLLRREERLGRHPADGDLHQLPQAHLERQPDARARPRELPDRQAAQLERRSTTFPTSCTSTTASTWRRESAASPATAASTRCASRRSARRSRWSGASTATATRRRFLRPKDEDLRPDVGRRRPGDARRASSRRSTASGSTFALTNCSTCHR